MRILLVEDDELLGDGIRTGLVHFGYTVDWIKDGKSAHTALVKLKATFDIIVLDLGLPKMPGLELLAELRQHGIKVPVLILTAHETIEDRVKGLDAGADDYLTKPFDLDELCARIRALQRRSQDRSTTEIRYGDITLDPAAHAITYQGEEVNIPRREFTLLRKLIENQGKVISRDQLSQTLYGWEDNIDSNALEVHIHNLRKRFGQDTIKTIRGIGYMAKKTESESS